MRSSCCSSPLASAAPAAAIPRIWKGPGPRLRHDSGKLMVTGNAALTAMAFPALEYVGEGVKVERNAQLASMEFPVLTSISGRVDMGDAASEALWQQGEA